MVDRIFLSTRKVFLERPQWIRPLCVHCSLPGQYMRNGYCPGTMALQTNLIRFPHQYHHGNHHHVYMEAEGWTVLKYFQCGKLSLVNLSNFKLENKSNVHCREFRNWPHYSVSNFYMVQLSTRNINVNFCDCQQLKIINSF